MLEEEDEEGREEDVMDCDASNSEGMADLPANSRT